MEDLTQSISSLPIWMALILLVATALAWPISISLILFYRRAVWKSMRRGANVANPSGPTPAQQVSQPVSELQFVDSRETARISDLRVFKHLVRRPWRVAMVYVFAGTTFALIMAAAVLLGLSEGEFVLARLISLFWIYAWPIVLTINIIAAASWRPKIATVLIYFLMLASIVIAINAGSSEPNWTAHGTLWLLYNAPASLILFAFLNRRVRPVGPLVLIFLMVSAFGSLLVISLLASSEALMRLAANLGPSAEITFIALNLLGFVLAAPFGWLILHWIRKRYERKKTSDQAIAVDAIWLLFAVVMSIQLSPNGLWACSGLFAFLVYKVVSVTGLYFIRRSSDGNRKLLVLRVFSLGKRSQRLFRWLVTYWRYAGSVQLIAGTDLATDNLEPHEFLDFLSGKLGRRFINDPPTLDRKLAELDARPDHDGRFRVNEFFCHDHTWRHVLNRLVSDTDVVFMDLRGFSRRNGGCIFEINELINAVSLDRVQFVTDVTTDEPFLVEAIRRSWQHVQSRSPNILSQSPQLRMFRMDRGGSLELRALLKALATASEQ
ncbi:MAG: hypothetical protein ABR607_04440 [Pyrinomonadaceae bacterium]